MGPVVRSPFNSVQLLRYGAPETTSSPSAAGQTPISSVLTSGKIS
jgi:hypothetical protein